MTEFEVGGYHYRKRTVRYFSYDDGVGRLTYDGNIPWKEGNLMLRVLEEGRATLYSHNDGFERFFYSTGAEVPELLVYRRHLNLDNSIVTNRKYQAQLREKVYCAQANYNQLQYTASSLKKVFALYNNNCEKVKKENKRAPFSAGVYVTSGMVTHRANNSIFFYLNNIKMEPKPILKAGFDVEYFLPFNHNAFSLVFSPGFMTYKNQHTVPYDQYPHTQHFSVDISALEFPIGGRYTHFITENQAAVVTAQYKVPVILHGTYTNNEFSYNIELLPGYNFGLGYRFRNLIAEANYQTGYMYLHGSAFTEMQLSSFMFSLRYRLK